MEAVWQVVAVGLISALCGYTVSQIFSGKRLKEHSSSTDRQINTLAKKIDDLINVLGGLASIYVSKSDCNRNHDQLREDIVRIHERLDGGAK